MNHNFAFFCNVQHEFCLLASILNEIQALVSFSFDSGIAIVCES